MTHTGTTYATGIWGCRATRYAEKDSALSFSIPGALWCSGSDSVREIYRVPGLWRTWGTGAGCGLMPRKLGSSDQASLLTFILLFPHLLMKAPLRRTGQSFFHPSTSSLSPSQALLTVHTVPGAGRSAVIIHSQARARSLSEAV